VGRTAVCPYNVSWLIMRPTPFPAHRYALALHTSSPELGLALSNFAGDQRQQVWALGRDTASLLHTHWVEFMAPHPWEALEFLAVARGPGGFTGTRIGVVAARTLAQQLQIPLFAISSLAAIAWQTAHTQPGLIAVTMPAQRGQCFTGVYEVNPAAAPVDREAAFQTLQPDQVMSAEQWQQTFATLQDGRSPITHIAAAAGQGEAVPAVLDLAYHQWRWGDRPNWSTALPFYGQHPVETS
jgi:tRNA threonylcarbamoyl adenosine modification protein YeaZ